MEQQDYIDMAEELFALAASRAHREINSEHLDDMMRKRGYDVISHGKLGRQDWCVQRYGELGKINTQLRATREQKLVYVGDMERGVSRYRLQAIKEHLAETPFKKSNAFIQQLDRFFRQLERLMESADPPDGMSLEAWTEFCELSFDSTAQLVDLLKKQFMLNMLRAGLDNEYKSLPAKVVK